MIKIVDLNLKFNSLTPMNVTPIGIVIHHTGAGTNDDQSASTIHQGHLNQGWAGIGYHYVIRKNGNVEIGRPHWTVGAHEPDANSDTLGIHLSGNFEIGEPTQAQLDSLVELVCYLKLLYPTIQFANIKGHRDYYNTACPGKFLYNKLAGIRDKVKSVYKNEGYYSYAKMVSSDTGNNVPSNPTTDVDISKYDRNSEFKVNAHSGKMTITSIKDSIISKGKNYHIVFPDSPTEVAIYKLIEVL
jgi:Negative regulator of beta-lactamase expression